MSFNLQHFGRDYRRLLQLSSVLAHLPASVSYRLAALFGQHLGPLRWQETLYHEGFLAGGLPGDWHALWCRRVQNHAASCMNIFLHDRWDTAWFQRHVVIDMDGMQSILANGRGCLFLTYHHLFQHTLCSLLGLAGFAVNALAAPEETSAIYEEVGPFIHLLHQGSASQFNGGTYLFVTTPRQAVRMTEEALSKNSVLISLHDFPVIQQHSAHFAGRRIYAPNGSIRVAQKLGAAIVVGGVIREGLSYRILYRQLDAGQPYPLIVQAYFDYLIELSRSYPYFWDGWEWFSGLPLDVAAA